MKKILLIITLLLIVRKTNAEDVLFSDSLFKISTEKVLINETYNVYQIHLNVVFDGRLSEFQIPQRGGIPRTLELAKILEVQKKKFLLCIATNLAFGEFGPIYPSTVPIIIELAEKVRVHDLGIQYEIDDGIDYTIFDHVFNLGDISFLTIQFIPKEVAGFEIIHSKELQRIFVINKKETTLDDRLLESGFCITTQNLKLRESPTLTGKEIAIIPKGSSITSLYSSLEYHTISGITDTWFYVEYNDLSGWAFAGYIKKK